MGVSMAVVHWLRSQGHDALHLREHDLQRAGDAEVFAKAVAEQRVILTFDLDFGEIAALSQGRKASVVLFRLANARSANVIDRLTAVMTDCVPALEGGRRGDRRGVSPPRPPAGPPLE